MAIATKKEGDVCIIGLNGEIDANTGASIRSEILELAESETKILLDFTDVSYMSSAGIRIVMQVYRAIQSKSGKLVLVGLSEEIKDTMEVTGFLPFFTVSPSVEEGLKALA